MIIISMYGKVERKQISYYLSVGNGNVASVFHNKVLETIVSQSIAQKTGFFSEGDVIPVSVIERIPSDGAVA